MGLLDEALRLPRTGGAAGELDSTSTRRLKAESAHPSVLPLCPSLRGSDVCAERLYGCKVIVGLALVDDARVRVPPAERSRDARVAGF